MTFTVLISVYRKEKAVFLDRALQSVWSDQTLKPDTIVLVKDGELGKELDAVITKWKDLIGKSLCVLRNPNNLGLSKSLNIGIKHISTDLIARMDTDDIALPDRFKKQVEYMKSHPDVDILGGSIIEFNDSCDNLNVRTYPTEGNDIRKYICKANPLAHPAVMMRKKIFDEGLLYNESFPTSQDIALWIDALKKGYRIANLEEPILKFRLVGDVFKRRGGKDGWVESKYFFKGVYHLHGLFTWRYIYPLARLICRLMPVKIVKKIYDSNLRDKLYGTKKES